MPLNESVRGGEGGQVHANAELYSSRPILTLYAGSAAARSNQATMTSRQPCRLNQQYTMQPRSSLTNLTLLAGRRGFVAHLCTDTPIKFNKDRQNKLIGKGNAEIRQRAFQFVKKLFNGLSASVFRKLNVGL